MPQGQGEHALGKLLREAREAQGLTTTEISQRLGDKEDGRPHLRRTTLNRIETEPRKDALEARTVGLLAQGYGLPGWLIWAKTGEALGIPARDDTLPEVATRFEGTRYRQLSPKHVSLLVAIADAILGAEQGSPKPV